MRTTITAHKPLIVVRYMVISLAVLTLQLSSREKILKLLDAVPRSV